MTIETISMIEKRSYQALQWRKNRCTSNTYKHELQPIQYITQATQYDNDKYITPNTPIRTNTPMKTTVTTPTTTTSTQISYKSALYLIVLVVIIILFLRSYMNSSSKVNSIAPPNY